MQASSKYRTESPEFWANVRLISQNIGYTTRLTRTKGIKTGPGPIKVPRLDEIVANYKAHSLATSHLEEGTGPTPLGQKLLDYFQYRADTLNQEVQPLFMDATEAELEYKKLRKQRKTPLQVRMNKQSKEKKRLSYFSLMIQMLIEQSIAGQSCDFDPQELTLFTHQQAPFRTLARRIDGAFPSAVDPKAIWEIKEYYHTTTFGSRVADGVYETMLDGLELLEMKRSLEKLTGKSERDRVQHLLLIDGRYTWWDLGRSYLCRIIDMLHMGYVDEVLFGREIFTRLPVVASEWLDKPC